MTGLVASSPFFLWMAPLAALPIVFHLFLRIQKRRRTFPSLMFFYRVDPRLNARRQIREWLVLLLRALVILLAMLALSRPVWLGVGGGGRVSTVLLIDNSGSMSAKGSGGRPKHEQAAEAAGAVIAELGKEAMAGIVLLVDDPTVFLPDGLSSDKDALRSALDQITPTEATGSPADALARAFALLDASPDSRFEVHVFTDLQESEWNRPPPDLRPARPGTNFIVHRFFTSAAKEANVSILENEIPRRRLLTGRRFPARVTLSNATPIEARIRLHSVDDQGRKSSQSVTVPSDGEAAATLLLDPATPGFHWVNIWLEGDGFGEDNRAGLAYTCADQARVLFAGQREDFGFLPIALAPTGLGKLSGLKPLYAPSTDWMDKLKTGEPVLLIITWNDLSRLHTDIPDMAGALRNYVKEGGSLLVVPSPKGADKVESVPDWAGAASGETRRAQDGLPVLAFEKNAPLWQGMRDEKGEVLLRNVKAFRFVTLRLSDDSQALLGLEDGSPLLGHLSLGAGAVYTSGLAFDPSWCTLPLKGSSLAMFQNMALGSGTDIGRAVSLAAGERLHGVSEGDPKVHIRSVAGSALDWKGNLTSFPVFPRSGVYAIQDGEKLEYVSVRSSDKEGRARFVSGGTVPVLGGVSHSVSNYADIPTFLDEFRARRKGMDLYLPLILFALLALLLEGWLVNPLPRKSRRPEMVRQTAARSPSAVMAGITAVGTLQWHPRLGPLLCGLLILGLCAFVVFLYRRLLSRFPRRRALWLAWPKVALLMLLVFAVLDPVWSRERHQESQSRVLLLVDTSSSMDVQDQGEQSRISRAEKILESIKRSLPAEIKVKEVEFDSEIREREDGAKKAEPKDGEPKKIRETDLGGCMLKLAERSDIASYMGIVALTDGGDEIVQSAKLPPVPLSIVGIGTDSRQWNDLVISDVKHPLTVEKEVDFEISVDVLARTGGGAGFQKQLKKVTVQLERQSEEAWLKEGEQEVDLSHRRARVKFKITGIAEPGLRRFRVSLAKLDGEISHRNNSRIASVDIRKRSLHVLFFTRELGMDFKMVRNELARDPGITFTALFRTISERFTVQGERPEGEADLESGFPPDDRILKLYDCIVFGSFAAEHWTEAQMQALLKYIEQGGAAVFLGGEESFGRGGYANTPLAPIFPWQISEGEPELQAGRFSVNIPPASANHPVTAGLKELLAEGDEPVIESLNSPGQLRPVAVALLNAIARNRTVAVIAVQPFGQGKTMGAATNTLWKWARKSRTLREAYGLFWRQAVRNLTGSTGDGRILSVDWDRELYRPGEQALAEIRVAGKETHGLRLSASLTRADDSRPISVDPPASQQESHRARVIFRGRGEYLFRLVAYQGDYVLESYEKTFRIAPQLEEGANLEVNHEFLKRLSEKAGGTYVREDEADKLVEMLSSRLSGKTIIVETPLVQAGPYFALLLLVIMISEWVLRRKMNLF
ncbi:MAG: VWA domain-containing protein [Planctomycetota bacterium]|nr:VWA domain-containing protein [Planctomycetota bacterium]